MLISYKLFQKVMVEVIPSNLFYEGVITLIPKPDEWLLGVPFCT